jgi:DNA-binding GntR family transcriptional regulator
LVNTRVVIESAALRIAMQLGDDQWEADILAALHKLERFSATRGPRAFNNFPAEYDALHKEFHTSLIKGCNSARLMQIHGTLYEQTFRYRSFLMARDARLRTVDDEHATIAGMVVRREAEAACAAITSHLRSLLEL